MEQEGGKKRDRDENRRRPTRPRNGGSPLLRWPGRTTKHKESKEETLGRRLNEVSRQENIQTSIHSVYFLTGEEDRPA